MKPQFIIEFSASFLAGAATQNDWNSKWNNLDLMDKTRLRCEGTTKITTREMAVIGIVSDSLTSNTMLMAPRWNQNTVVQLHLSYFSLGIGRNVLDGAVALVYRF